MTKQAETPTTEAKQHQQIVDRAAEIEAPIGPNGIVIQVKISGGVDPDGKLSKVNYELAAWPRLGLTPTDDVNMVTEALIDDMYALLRQKSLEIEADINARFNAAKKALLDQRLAEKAEADAARNVPRDWGVLRCPPAPSLCNPGDEYTVIANNFTFPSPKHDGVLEFGGPTSNLPVGYVRADLPAEQWNAIFKPMFGVDNWTPTQGEEPQHLPHPELVDHGGSWFLNVRCSETQKTDSGLPLHIVVSASRFDGRDLGDVVAPNRAKPKPLVKE